MIINLPEEYNKEYMVDEQQKLREKYYDILRSAVDGDTISIDGVTYKIRRTRYNGHSFVQAGNYITPNSPNRHPFWMSYIWLDKTTDKVSIYKKHATITLKCDCCGYEQVIKKRLDKKVYRQLGNNKGLYCNRTLCTGRYLDVPECYVIDGGAINGWNIIRLATPDENESIQRAKAVLNAGIQQSATENRKTFRLIK